MKSIHILAGLLALLAGAIALFSAKGAPLHRRSGSAFAVAMLVLSATGLVMAVLVSPNRVNVIAALLTFYLVGTGYLAVRRSLEPARGLLTGFMLLALCASGYAFSLAFEAIASATGRVDGIPAPPLLMFGSVGLIGGLLDARLLLAGRIDGAHRLARHLWRMGFALWIATMSFFLGQARHFPTPIRKSGLLAVPVLLVLVTIVYWLMRVLHRRKPLPQSGRAETAPGE
jgi:uncharacterized membrane protein